MTTAIEQPSKSILILVLLEFGSHFGFRHIQSCMLSCACIPMAYLLVVMTIGADKKEKD